MLELSLVRVYPKADYTIGFLYVRGKYFCATLEDTDRGLTKSMSLAEIKRLKVAGKTAIPRGTYTVKLSISPKFKNRSWAKPYGGLVPSIEDVPGYVGVRIHPGNTAADTEGCILPGTNTQPGKVLQSTAYYRKLMDQYLYPAYLSGEEIRLTIKGA